MYMCFARRKAMLINNLFAFIGGSLMCLSKLCRSFEMMVLGRLVIGAYCGQCSTPPIQLTHCDIVSSKTCPPPGAFSSFYCFVLFGGRISLRFDAHVCGWNCSNKPSGGVGHAAPVGYRHWDSDSAGNGPHAFLKFFFFHTPSYLHQW